MAGGIEARAFPFDQGRRDKFDPQPTDIFDKTDPNLGGDEWDELLEWLGKQRLVFHNAKFDLHHMKNGTRHFYGVELEQATVWDTMIVQPLLDPLTSPALKTTAARLWGSAEAAEQAEVQRALRAQGTGLTERFDLVDWSILGPYAAQDARLTLRLAEVQMRRLETDDAHLAPLAEREIALMRVLYKMEQRGIGFDGDRCKRNAEVMRAAKVELEKALPFKATLPAAKAYFYGTLGIIRQDQPTPGREP